MSRWRIDSERTSFFVSFRPGLPGLGLRVTGVTGTFEATLDARGQPHLEHPIEGEFQMTVDDLSLGPPVFSRAVGSFLGGDDEVAVRGWMGDVHPLGDDEYRFGLRLHLRGNEDTIDAVGRTALLEDGTVKVHGTSEVDPRGLGVPIPRLIPLRCRAAWDLRILPDD